MDLIKEISVQDSVNAEREVVMRDYKVILKIIKQVLVFLTIIFVYYVIVH